MIKLTTDIKTFCLLLLFGLLSIGAIGQTQTNTLDKLDWMVGYWKGDGFGGTVEELWMPRSGNSMSGVFRLFVDGEPVFTEYLLMLQTENEIIYKVKHFSADGKPWEEKEIWIDFPLIKITENKAEFKGLLFERTDDQLQIDIEL